MNPGLSRNCDRGVILTDGHGPLCGREGRGERRAGSQETRARPGRLSGDRKGARTLWTSVPASCWSWAAPGPASRRSPSASSRPPRLVPSPTSPPGPVADATQDAEWAARVAAHRARRLADWETVEVDSGADLAGALGVRDRRRPGGLPRHLAGRRWSGSARENDVTGPLVGALDDRRRAGLLTVLVSEEVGPWGASLVFGRPAVPRRAGNAQPRAWPTPRIACCSSWRAGCCRSPGSRSGDPLAARGALAFLTPLGGAAEPTPGALAWFPVVGAGLGGVLGLRLVADQRTCGRSGSPPPWSWLPTSR